ncbi:MAG: peptidoglycan editing factor PgeF [Pseudomonadota bacterium]
MSSDWIKPDWPLPRGVRAVTTTRRPQGLGTASAAPFDDFNLGDHVGDDPRIVADHRAWLERELGLPLPPRWLNQVHGQRVVNIAQIDEGEPADAAVAFEAGACAVLTADCLPVLLCDQKGRAIGAAHAGWRGLAAGVLENTVAAMNTRPQTLMAWLGPAIGPAAFEVGAEVVEAFVTWQPAAEACFKQRDESHWLADIYQLARLRLQAAGIGYIYGGDYCTHSDAERFYSYRRDGQTGRMASLIWFESL